MARPVDRVLVALFTKILSNDRLREEVHSRTPKLISRQAATRLFCEWVMNGDSVLSMQGAVYLAALFPLLGDKLRKSVVDRLKPGLEKDAVLWRREASAYALQYSEDSEIRALIRLAAVDTASSECLREIATEALQEFEE